jgi:hypothetical protein
MEIIVDIKRQRPHTARIQSAQKSILQAEKRPYSAKQGIKHLIEKGAFRLRFQRIPNQFAKN